MTRPDSISPEQIATWDAQIAADEALHELIPSELISQPEFREVLYAGLWLVEQLRSFGQDETTVLDIQYAHGRQSFGNDPWIIAKIFADAYKYSVTTRKMN